MDFTKRTRKNPRKKINCIELKFILTTNCQAIGDETLTNEEKEK